MHIAAAHFGALIEAVQRRYINANPDGIQTKIIADKEVWNALSDEVDRAISMLGISDEGKRVLFANVGSLNRLPQRAILAKLMNRLNIVFGADEEKAWKRRNDAAHGIEMEDGSELETIRDTKLLKVLFHRILLSMTNASDTYYDYVTPGFPIRNLRDPVPPGP